MDVREKLRKHETVNDNVLPQEATTDNVVRHGETIKSRPKKAEGENAIMMVMILN